MTKRWYVVHVYAGAEKKVADDIRAAASKQGITESIDEIIIPANTTVEVKRGRKVNTEHRLMPGYILVHADLHDNVWHLVRQTPKVQGFLGSRLRPMPISEAEATRFRTMAAESAESPIAGVPFEVGEQVRVADGPFSSFTGTVDEVDEERGRLKVSVSIFGRSTPVDLEYTQVEKT